MISLNLNDLKNIEDSSIVYPASSETYNMPIRGISIDTRTLQPREIFWAISGDSFDGHWFVNEAEKKGVQLLWWRKKNQNVYHAYKFHSSW